MDIPTSGLTLCIDFNSLTTYVALGETRKLVRDCQLEVHWFPMVSTPGSLSVPIVSSDPLSEYKTRRARARKMFADRELQRNCERMGIAVEEGCTTFDPTTAALGLLWLDKNQADAEHYWHYCEAVYSAAFREQKPVEDANLVGDILSELTLPSAGFDDHESVENLREIQAKLLEIGIFNSPAYLYDGERFQGRQHLPLLRWLMGDRRKPPPV